MPPYQGRNNVHTLLVFIPTYKSRLIDLNFVSTLYVNLPKCSTSLEKIEYFLERSYPIPKSTITCSDPSMLSASYSPPRNEIYVSGYHYIIIICYHLSPCASPSSSFIIIIIIICDCCCFIAEIYLSDSNAVTTV